MKIFFILFFALLFIGNAYSQRRIANTDSVFNVVNHRIDSAFNIVSHRGDSNFNVVTQRINNSQTQIENFSENLHQSNEGIANQISSATNYLTIWGLLFGFLGIGLGIYVTWMQSRTSRLLNQSRAILEEQQRIQSQVEATRKLIETDLTGLYKKLQEEEINYLLNRLKHFPEDIGNLFGILATIELPQKYYIDYKIIMANAAKSENEKVKEKFDSLIKIGVQHFSKNILNDNEIRPLVFDRFQKIINGFFTHEILSFTDSFADYILNKGISNNIDLSKKFLLVFERDEERYFAPKEYHEREYPDIINILFQKLATKDRQIEYFELLKDEEKLIKFKVEYQKLLDAIEINN